MNLMLIATIFNTAGILATCVAVVCQGRTINALERRIDVVHKDFRAVEARLTALFRADNKQSSILRD